MELLKDDFLADNVFVVVRIDGVAFHTVTRGINKPFDPFFHYVLDTSFIKGIHSFDNSWLLAYTQSDECSIVFPKITIPTIRAYGGRLRKWLSILPSLITNNFQRNLIQLYPEQFYKENPSYVKFRGDPDEESIIYSNVRRRRIGFDCKLFVFDTKEEVLEYLTGRRVDAIRNAKMSFARTMYSQKQLNGVHADEAIEMMIKDGYDFNNIPKNIWRGTLFENKLCEDLHDFHENDKSTEKYIETVLYWKNFK